MATIAEIKQQLIQSGIDPANAQAVARILAEPVPIDAPTGELWDTLRAKNFRVSRRFGSGGFLFRLVTNGSKEIIVVTTPAGINSVYGEINPSTL